MNKEKLINIINEGENLLNNIKTYPTTGGKYIDDELLNKWKTRSKGFLASKKEFSMYKEEFEKAFESCYSSPEGVRSSLGVLKAILEDLPEEDSSNTMSLHNSNEDYLLKIFNRFHEVAKQLLQRHSKRNTIKIEDEYDAQDLLHGLFKIFFEDVRSEEWTPSYAGGTSRMDFLLKKENQVIEVKKTRNSHTDKILGEELLIDIAKYQSHPNCKELICFVYDPDSILKNPRGIENDLTKTHGDLIVKVFIRP